MSILNVLTVLLLTHSEWRVLCLDQMRGKHREIPRATFDEAEYGWQKPGTRSILNRSHRCGADFTDQLLRHIALLRHIPCTTVCIRAFDPFRLSGIRPAPQPLPPAPKL